MPEFAPLFVENGSVLPKNTQPLSDRDTFDEIADKTIGAAAGAAAAKTRARVQHSQQGDTQKIETINMINRNTTAADVTALKSKVKRKNASLAFPKDLSGNGGPAFTRV